MYGSTVEIAAEFANVINEELKGLVAAGADFIQIDEPARGTVTGQEMARLFNMATEGVDAKLAFHICFGNRFGQARFKRTYADYFPGAMDANAHQFVLEFASREMAEIDMWKRWNDGRELGAGIIDVKSFYPETPEDVAERLRTVLESADATGCTSTPTAASDGRRATSRWRSSTRWSAGTRIVREELGA